jgi:hypothetical protein
MLRKCTLICRADEGIGMKRRRAIMVTALCLTMLGTGCAIVCGPVHTLPPQRLHLIAASPSIYTIRVIAGEEFKTDTLVPPDGRVAFDVPLGSRYCTSYLLGFIKVDSPTPVEKRRVIRVMRGEKAVRKLSAEDIAKLPADFDGYHILKMDD